MKKRRAHRDEELREFLEGEICELEYRGEKICTNPARGIIRTRLVCGRHFNHLKIDNLKRNKLGLEIPTDFKLVKELTKAQERHRI